MNRRLFLKRIRGLGLLLAAASSLLVAAERSATASDSDDSFRAARLAAAHRQRRIIYDNDGNEPFFEMKGLTRNEFLEHRTAALAGSQVDTIIYCGNAGFGLSTRKTDVWSLHRFQAEPYTESKFGALLDAGIDNMQVIVEFGHEHGMEVFTSIRVNDTHDAGSSVLAKARIENTPFKKDHPERLLGTPESRPRHGGWAAVNYARQDVQDSLFHYAEEAMVNYDLDGVHLDFFRHPVFFPSTAAGQLATDEERRHMSQLLRRIRTRADEIGRARKRPLLISVRVPDSARYCHDIGLDLENWLADGLVDMLVVASYFQLNDWSVTAELGRRYKVPVYPSLDESRVPAELDGKARNSLESFRARAAVAFDSGCNGIATFNLFNPRSPIFRECGDAEQLRKLPRTYFASPIGLRKAAGGNLPTDDYCQVETLNPERPKALTQGEPVSARLYLGANFKTLPGQRATLQLRFTGVAKPAQVEVTLNGHVQNLTPGENGWLKSEPDAASLSGENNDVKVTLKEPVASASWTDLLLHIEPAR
ncbi:MAG TPA: hypothetical protein VM452_11415 [Caulifigura sp.]|jgi:hypothetical protein|nr:hypothetical protein [Caulifigura sp.]